MSIKSFKQFVVEYTSDCKKASESTSAAGGEKAKIEQGSSETQDKSKTASSDGVTQGKPGEKTSVKQGSSKIAEGSGASADDLEPNEQKDDETKELKPRSKGEKDFADDHKKKADKVDHPVATDAQFKG
jgi:hypothetical protein